MGVYYSYPAMAQLDTPQEKFAFLSAQANAVAQAMMQAKARGDTADLQNLRALLLKIRGDSGALIEEARADEMPSTFMLQLSDFSDWLSSLLGDPLGGLAKSLNLLPVLLIGLLVVAGIGLYKGTLSAKVPIV